MKKERLLKISRSLNCLSRLGIKLNKKKEKLFETSFFSLKNISKSYGNVNDLNPD